MKPGPLFDCSSTVTIVNDMPTVSLTLKGSGVEHGTLINAPSKIIQPQGATTMMVNDDAGLYGSKGWVSYVIGGDGAEIMILFECPFNQWLYKNDVSAAPSDHTTVGAYARTGPLRVEVRIH